MSERNRDPDPHPSVSRLVKPGTVNEPEDVISIVGFNAERDEHGTLRLFAEEECQRYLDIPDGDFIHAEAVAGDERGRMRIYVRRDLMTRNLFGTDEETEAVLACIDGGIVGAGLSTWQFLPQNRVVAAGLMGMLEEDERYRYEEEMAQEGVTAS